MPPRRKQKPPEYEPDPVLSTPQAPEKNTTRIATSQTRIGVIPDKPDGVLPIVGDNTAKTKGFDEIYEKVASKHRELKVIRPPKVPDKSIETPIKPSVTTGKVGETEAIVRESIDEYVPGWGKVFGRKDKEVKTT